MEGSDASRAGLANGQLRLHNLKYDKTLLALAHDADDAVTALAFRTDGEPLLVSGTASGSIVLTGE